MKFKKYSRIRHFIRDKILLPIANKLIGCRKVHIHRIRYKDCFYEARYHRLQYFWDQEPITIKGIIHKRRTYVVDYWDGGNTGRVWCEMFGWGEKFIHVKRGEDIELLVTNELERVIAMWRKYVSHTEEK